MTEFRTPTADDIAFVAAHMRDEDVLEVLDSGGHTPLGALVESVRASDACFTAVINDEVTCILGFVRTGDQEASVWLLGTDGLRRHAREVTRHTARILDGWNDWLGDLYNFVSTDAKQTRRWLRLLGFTEGPAEPYGIDGELFHRVSRKCVNP